MIRNLRFPDDARQVIDSMHASLSYDAAIALLGNICSKAKIEGDTPDFSAPFRCGGGPGARAADEAVRRDAPGLFSRFSLISMVSRLEFHARLLLLQRRILEELRTPKKRMTSDAMWKILKNVYSEARGGPVKMCSEFIVKQPSQPLLSRMKWLEGIYKVRNCLAHRLGQVQMEDIKPKGKSLKDVQEGDRLRAIWLRLKAFENGHEIESFPFTKSKGALQISFEEYEREWGIGEQIEITPQDCQFIAMSLSLLGNHLLADFEREMNVFLGVE